jgi:hypothetical protein
MGTDMKKVFSNQSLMEHMKDFASIAFKEGGEVRPMWLLMDAKGKIQPVITSFGSPEEKDACADFIRVALRAHRAVRYGFMSEAWYLSVRKGHPDYDHPEKVPPSEHQDRREVINLMVEDDQGGCMVGRYFILRPEIGKPTLSKFEQDGDLGRAGGRFSGLFQGGMR